MKDKIENWGASVQLVFVDDTVRRLCTTQELLVRTFGEAWRSVKLCLTVISGAETLADVAAFAALTVRRVQQTVEGWAEFDIKHAAIKLRVRALDRLPSGVTDDEQVALTLVREVSVLDVCRVVSMVGA